MITSFKDKHLVVLIDEQTNERYIKHLSAIQGRLKDELNSTPTDTKENRDTRWFLHEQASCLGELLSSLICENK